MPIRQFVQVGLRLDLDAQYNLTRVHSVSSFLSCVFTSILQFSPDSCMSVSPQRFFDLASYL